MALAVCFSALSPLMALQGNAVETEKRKFEDLRRQQFPLWPRKQKIQNPRVILPPSKLPVVDLKEPARPCSVPLLNALRPGTSLPPMPRYRTESGRSVMPNVQLPAPPCDDGGKR